MKTGKQRERRRTARFAVIVLLVNLLAVALLGHREISAVNGRLSAHAQSTQAQFEEIFGNYERSFRLFSRMMAREIEEHPDPDAIWDYLKSVDAPLLEIEGETFDGLYM